MDVEALGVGREPEELPEQWVIFIMEMDPFGYGRGTYLYRRVCDDTSERLGDGTRILYVNGAYRGDDELGRLMHDFCESDPDAMLNELMAERVRYFKRTPKGEAEMCEVFDEIREEGIEIGTEKGIEIGTEKGIEIGTEKGIEIGTEKGIEIGVDRSTIEGLRSLMAKLGVSAQEALGLLGVPEARHAHFLAML